MMKKLNCPNCGASIKAEKVNDSYHCQYCLSTFEDTAGSAEKGIAGKTAVTVGIVAALALCICLAAAFSTSPATKEPPQPTGTGTIETGTIDSGSPEPSLSSLYTSGELSVWRGRTDEILLDDLVILDQDGIKLTLKSLDYDSYWGPGVKVAAENNSSQAMAIQTRGVSVNGIMIEPIFSCEVAPGKKANDEISFLPSQLKASGIETIKDVEMVIHVIDTSSWRNFFETDVISFEIPGAEDYVQAFDDSGRTVVDQEGLRIIVKDLTINRDFDDAELNVYIENNTDTDIMVQARNTSVNGFMIDPVFYADVWRGKKTFQPITFMDYQLEENRITDISEIELAFHIFSKDSYDLILESEAVTITF